MKPTPLPTPPAWPRAPPGSGWPRPAARPAAIAGPRIPNEIRAGLQRRGAGQAFAPEAPAWLAGPGAPAVHRAA